VAPVPEEALARLRAAAARIAASYGLEIFDLQFRRESIGWVLRVILDRNGPASTGPADDGVTIDVEELMAESMSIETEYGYRFILRGDERVSPTGVTQQCEVPDAVSALRDRGRQELPEALRRARMR